jgi:hypothetical protein
VLLLGNFQFAKIQHDHIYDGFDLLPVIIVPIQKGGGNYRKDLLQLRLHWYHPQ